MTPIVPAVSLPQHQAGMQSGGRWSVAAAAVVAGLVLAAAQVYLVARMAGAEGYLAGATQWDGQLYAHIAEHGYRASAPPGGADLDRMNVLFFPGYPIAGRAVAELLGLPAPAGLLLVSWLAAWVFWTYLFVILIQQTADGRLATWGIWLVALHPACFYLAVGYSESLFLAALLGFFYWAARGGTLGWTLAALHGVVLSATRIAGLPVVFYPVLDALAFGGALAAAVGWRERFRAAVGRWWPSAVAATGGLAFFGYCQWRFGQWDLYMDAQRAGWGVEADWLALLEAKNYFFYASLITPKALWVDDLSRLATLVMMTAFLAAAWLEVRLWRTGHRRGLRFRLALYGCAWAIFFVHAAGVSDVNMRSMLRYSLAPYTLLVLAGVQLAALYRPGVPAGLGWRIGRYLLAAAALAVQLALAWRFTHGLWVA